MTGWSKIQNSIFKANKPKANNPIVNNLIMKKIIRDALAKTVVDFRKMVVMFPYCNNLSRALMRILKCLFNAFNLAFDRHFEDTEVRIYFKIKP